MSFKDLALKPAYDSDRDDIVNDFYIPVLSNAKTYDRISGFFSSSALYIAARGIAQFIKNGGKMRLIIGAKLRKEDAEAIIKAKESPEEIISKRILDDIGLIEDELVLNHVKALAWMIAKGQLEIKVAIILGRDGAPLSEEAVANYGIFHQKVGIFKDNAGDAISFSGSVNESATAWKENVEEFKVFRSWVIGDEGYLKADYEKFDKYWEGRSERLRVIDVPRAVKEKLIQIAPNDLDSLPLVNIYSRTKRKKLRDYQLTAKEKWIENNRKGIFEMATGTGKTVTAISCIYDLIVKDKEQAVIVITCPYIHLVKQWVDELSNFDFSGVTAYGSSKEWKPHIMGKLLDFNNGRINSLIIVTTHDTFSSEAFVTAMTKVTGKLCLVADEMHGIGAPERQNGLLANYAYRLGLSATPRRWFDEEGTETLYSFFDKVVFEFPLKDAIYKINPDTGQSYLTPYEYHPLFVDLSGHEKEEYAKLTRKIALSYAKAQSSREQGELLRLFSIKRQQIVVNAEQKYVALTNILDKLGDFSHCLVYCAPNQIDRVQEMLNQRGILQHKFTAEESAAERANLLASFAEGNYRALVAMKCLDEGVDVPPTRYAILLANSGNPKEFIQRRGRVLRRFPGKEKAIIYDILVVPRIDGGLESTNMKLEAKIMKGEMRRFLEFANIALNSGDAIYKVLPYAAKYGIALGE